MNDEQYRSARCWCYRDDQRRWHADLDGVHIWWYAVVDDFGNLVWTPAC